MNTETVKLEIPDESYAALSEFIWSAHPRAEEFVRAIVTPVTIAELRRLAEVPQIAETPIRERLLSRADELEAGQ